MREGRVELPRPFGHRILRLLQPSTDLGSTCRPVPSGVVLCHPVSSRREQSVSRSCVYVDQNPRIGRGGKRRHEEGRRAHASRLPTGRPYHPRMDAPADFLRFVTQAAEDAVNFDGDAVAMASRARDGDEEAVAELTRAYAAIAVLTGTRLRPQWLPVPDAAQEAMLVLRRLIDDGSTTIAAELPSAIRATFAGLREPPDTQ